MTRSKPCATEHRIAYEKFVYVPPRRCEDQTDKQYEAQCRFLRERMLVLGILRATGQYVATVFGYHRDCDLAGCRRAGACKGRRREDDPRYPFAVVPPCGKGERMEPLRAAVCRIQTVFGEDKYILTETHITFHCHTDVITDGA